MDLPPFVPDARHGIEQGIANARMEGLWVEKEDAAILERYAGGLASLDEAAELLIARRLRPRAGDGDEA